MSVLIVTFYVAVWPIGEEPPCEHVFLDIPRGPYCPHVRLFPLPLLPLYSITDITLRPLFPVRITVQIFPRAFDHQASFISEM